MQRIKIPFGGLTAEQMEVLAELAEEYSDAICHVTTRQDIQLHFVHIEDTPDLSGASRRSASPRAKRAATPSATSPPARSPACATTESFDVTPYAKALAFFLLGHPDTQDFGRKFKIAFSGCEHEACGLVDDPRLRRHRPRVDKDGRARLRDYVGGGLGAVPHQAKLFDEFLPEEELLPMAQADRRASSRASARRRTATARA